MKNRQPLANMFVKAPFTLNEFFKDIIADELNIKAVTFNRRCTFIYYLHL